MKNPEANLTPSELEALGEQIAEDEGYGSKPTYGLNDPGRILQTLDAVHGSLDNLEKSLDCAKEELSLIREMLVAQTHG